MAITATHRRLMSLHLGRTLSQKEFVHHINGNQSDNCIENLQLVTPKEHRALHPRVRGKQTMNEKQIVGTGICQRCHQPYNLYYGQRRRYCPACQHLIRIETGRQGKNAQILNRKNGDKTR